MSAPARTRVLFVIPSLRLGGAERVVTLLANHLPRERFEVHLALVEKAGEFLSELAPDVEVHDLRARRVRWAVVPLVRLAGGYSPNRVAHDVLGQAGERLAPSS